MRILFAEDDRELSNAIKRVLEYNKFEIHQVYDGLEAQNIEISGGNIYVNGSGDGVGANGSTYVSGGYTLIKNPTNSGNGGLDYDGQAEITGGVFIAVGSQGNSSPVVMGPRPGR